MYYILAVLFGVFTCRIFNIIELTIILLINLNLRKDKLDWKKNCIIFKREMAVFQTKIDYR